MNEETPPDVSRDGGADPSLADLTPELYDRLTRLEQWWADWSYRSRLAELQSEDPARLRRAAYRAYTQACLLWMLLALPFALSGALLLGARTGSTLLNTAGGVLLTLVVGFALLMFQRVDRATSFFRQLDETDDPDQVPKAK